MNAIHFFICGTVEAGGAWRQWLNLPLIHHQILAWKAGFALSQTVPQMATYFLSPLKHFRGTAEDEAWCPVHSLARISVAWSLKDVRECWGVAGMLRDAMLCKTSVKFGCLFWRVLCLAKSDKKKSNSGSQKSTEKLDCTSVALEPVLSWPCQTG